MSNPYNGSEEKSLLSRTWFLVAAVVVVLLLAMGIFVSGAAILDDDEPPTAGTSTKPTVSGDATTPDDPSASVCGLPGHEAEGTLSEPPSATWSLVGQVALPQSDTAGPGVIEDSELRYCYAHTPEGALLAAANMYAWGEAAKSDPVAILERNVAAGPGYDAALAEAKNGYEETGEQQSPLQIRGFRLVSYTGDSSLVDLAFEAGGPGGYARHQIELVWERGDWRVRLDADGTPSDGGPLPDLTGYIPWSGA